MRNTCAESAFLLDRISVLLNVGTALRIRRDVGLAPSRTNQDAMKRAVDEEKIRAALGTHDLHGTGMGKQDYAGCKEGSSGEATFVALHGGRAFEIKHPFLLQKHLRGARVPTLCHMIERTRQGAANALTTRGIPSGTALMRGICVTETTGRWQQPRPTLYNIFVKFPLLDARQGTGTVQGDI